jgi:exodeoxyribonuclease VII small subunit
MTETYEELLKELKTIVQKIEDDGTSLDESIALYERGALLVKQCEEMLGKAEMKISQLGQD